jgi:hypothetical protein
LVYRIDPVSKEKLLQKFFIIFDFFIGCSPPFHLALSPQRDGGRAQKDVRTLKSGVFVQSMSEEGRGGSQSLNSNSLQETAKAMLLAAKGKTATYLSVGSGECPVQRGSVSHVPSLSSSSLSSSSSRVVESPVFEGRNLSNDTSYKHTDDVEVTFKRIVIVKTTTLHMVKGKNHE